MKYYARLHRSDRLRTGRRSSSPPPELEARLAAALRGAAICRPGSSKCSPASASGAGGSRTTRSRTGRPRAARKALAAADVAAERHRRPDLRRRLPRAVRAGHRLRRRRRARHQPRRRRLRRQQRLPRRAQRHRRRRQPHRAGPVPGRARRLLRNGPRDQRDVIDRMVRTQVDANCSANRVATLTGGSGAVAVLVDGRDLRASSAGKLLGGATQERPAAPRPVPLGLRVDLAGRPWTPSSRLVRATRRLRRAWLRKGIDLGLRHVHGAVHGDRRRRRC